MNPHLLRAGLTTCLLSLALASAANAQTTPLPRSPGGDVLHSPWSLPGSPSESPDPLPETSEPTSEEDGAESEERGVMVYRSAPETNSDLVQDTSAEVRLDDRTEPEDMLHYHAMFDPSVAPWKRNNARDVVNASGELVIGDPSRVPVPIASLPTSGDRALWYADIRVDLQPNVLAPLPSVAPDMRIRSVESTPPLPDMTFSVDSAGNFGVKAPVKGRVRLLLLVDAPNAYFGAPIPEGVLTRDAWRSFPRGRPLVPAPMQEAAERLWPLLQVHPSQPLSESLKRLVSWFRSFTAGPAPAMDGTLLESLVRGQRGVCRHRAHAFTILAQSLGIPARHVANEAHAFVEVHVPGERSGWRRIDLGGGADGLTIHGGHGHPPHVPGPDPFPRPPPYFAGATTDPPLQDSPHIITGLTPATEPPQGLGRALAWKPFTPPPAPGPEQRATDVQLLRTESSILRGESLLVEGIITDEAGSPLPGLPVWIELSSPDFNPGKVLQIGATHSDEEGRFSTQVVYPIQLSIGRYHLRARTPGDLRRAGAISAE